MSCAWLGPVEVLMISKDIAFASGRLNELLKEEGETGEPPEKKQKVTEEMGRVRTVPLTTHIDHLLRKIGSPS